MTLVSGWSGLQSRLRDAAACTALLAACAAFLPTAAIAQVASEVPDPEVLARLQAAYAGDDNPLCLISLVGEGDAQLVTAGCHGQGLVLGAAQSFETATNAAGDVQIVILRSTGSDRVLMLSGDQSGAPLVEDLTSTLARAAGRSAMANLRDIEVSLTRFVETGMIDLVPSGREGARRAHSAAFDAQAVHTAELERRGASSVETQAGGAN